MTALQIKNEKGDFVDAKAMFAELGKDGLGANAETRETARGVMGALMSGRATRDTSGRARTVVEFSGFAYDSWITGGNVDDPIIRAFIDPRTGALNRTALKEAAEKLLGVK